MLLLNRQNDVSGKRFRKAKYRHNVLNRDLFKSYKEKYNNEIDWSLFKDIILEFNSLFRESVVTNRDGAKLPFIGIIALAAFKPRRRVPMDFYNSNRTGLKVKHLNFETDGLACKIVFTSYYMKYRYRWSPLWKFKGVREFTRQASKSFRENHTKYKRLDLSKQYASKLFKDD